MKRCALCLVLLLASPLFATTIAFQQNNQKWNCSGTTGTGGTITCQVGLTPKNPGDLFVIWTTWQSAGSFTASVADGTNEQMKNFPSAVGPTVQSASGGGPISARLTTLPMKISAVTTPTIRGRPVPAT